MSIFLIVLLAVLAVCYPLYKAATCGLVVLERKDGDFQWLDLDKEEMLSWFNAHGLKPIELSTVTIQPYFLRVKRRDGTEGSLSIPPGYCSDGVSKPLRHLSPIPHDREGSYWVYHDWMYQKQAWDDGRDLSKEEADDLMNLLILAELATLWHPYKLLYRFLAGCYKCGDTGYRHALKRRGVAMLHAPPESEIRFAAAALLWRPSRLERRPGHRRRHDELQLSRAAVARAVLSCPALHAAL